MSSASTTKTSPILYINVDYDSKSNFTVTVVPGQKAAPSLSDLESAFSPVSWSPADRYEYRRAFRQDTAAAGQVIYGHLKKCLSESEGGWQIEKLNLSAESSTTRRSAAQSKSDNIVGSVDVSIPWPELGPTSSKRTSSEAGLLSEPEGMSDEQSLRVPDVQKAEFGINNQGDRRLRVRLLRASKAGKEEHETESQARQTD